MPPLAYIFDALPMYGIHTHFMGNRTIKNILVKPKGKNTLDRKVGLSTSTNMGSSCGMRNTRMRHPRTLGRDTKNISKNRHQSMDIATFQDIKPTLTTSPL